MKKIINIFISGVMAFSLLTGVGSLVAVTTGVSVVHAATPKEEVKNGVEAIGGDKNGRTADSFTNLLTNIINILLFIIGAVAVIMIIIGGIKYTTSNGDQAQVTSAKNTILYAVVGLVVAIMSYAIVNFVLKSL